MGRKALEMERGKLSAKLKTVLGNPKLWVGASVFFGFALVLLIVAKTGGGSLNPFSVFKVFGKAAGSVQFKIDEMAQLEIDNQQLVLENAKLKKWSESLMYGCEVRENEKNTQKTGLKLSAETGTKMGRTLAGIRYVPPANLAPQQLFSLGVSYFDAGEDEKSAVIFTYLTGLEENVTYKTPKHYLLAAVSWYRLEHFNESNHYLDKVLDEKDSKEVLPYKAQARLWKALIAQRLNQAEQAQTLLKDLLDHHPRSPESKWVNYISGEVQNREPAAHVKEDPVEQFEVEKAHPESHGEEKQTDASHSNKNNSDKNHSGEHHE